MNDLKAYPYIINKYIYINFKLYKNSKRE